VKVALAGLIGAAALAAGLVLLLRGGDDRRRSPAATRPDRAETPTPAATPRRRPPVAYAPVTTARVRKDLRGLRPRVYVPNSDAGTVDVIDPRRMRVVRRMRVGSVPHHVTPSWDLRRLYVDNTGSNTLTELDRRTGRIRRTIPVTDPYNLYFTPDGRRAVVVAERERRLDIRDPRSWRLIKSVPIPWPGADHLDFSRDGRHLLVSAEFSGRVVRVRLRRPRVTGVAKVGGLPVDVKADPSGRRFYVANQGRGGVSVVDPRRMRESRFIRTGAGAHGLALARDPRYLYVSNRLAGSISVVDTRRRRVRRTWKVGGSPDMLQVSGSGRRLWYSNRFHGSISALDTRSGKVLATIPTGHGAHGLTYYPQPGDFTVGHNGVYGVRLPWRQ